jgi:uncharacterized DUF497 family protein
MLVLVNFAVKRSRAYCFPRLLLSYSYVVEFDWAEAKAASNLTKHEVGFEEATTGFDNPLAVIFDDEKHSTDERREIIIGHSQRNRLLLVSFTERAHAVRLVSARLATRKERKAYEENALP